LSKRNKLGAYRQVFELQRDSRVSITGEEALVGVLISDELPVLNLRGWSKLWQSSSAAQVHL